MGIVEQLVKLYYECEYEAHGKLTEFEALKYYDKMLANGRIQVITEGGNVMGFIESWRLTMEQLGRVVCWTNFSALYEDVTKGEVAYVSDIWVRPGRRDEGMVDQLIEAFKEANKDADYFVSKRVKSQGKCRYIRVYDKVNGYKIKENDNGK
jgi:ribosomal protein S18 acetylase RimI-like enzyme